MIKKWHFVNLFTETSIKDLQTSIVYYFPSWVLPRKLHIYAVASGVHGDFFLCEKTCPSGWF